MADSIVEIVSTTLSATELPDGNTSYDLITTDANTSYVIKDVEVQALGSDLNAEINSFPVGNWNQSLTGSEVVDVSSTVSVSSPNLPFKKVAAIFNPSLHRAVSGSVGFSSQVFGEVNKNTFNSTKEVLAIPSDYYAVSGGGYWNSLIREGDYFYQITNVAGTGSRQVNSWDAAGVKTNLVTGNAAIFYAPDKDAIFYNTSTQLKKITLSTNTVTTLSTNFINPSTNHRESYCNGWLFYQSSTSPMTSIYAFNAETGTRLLFNNMLNIGTVISEWKFAVSYNADSDEFALYRTTSTKFLWRETIPLTKTEMDSYVVDTTISLAPDFNSNVGSYDVVFDIAANLFGDAIYGHPYDFTLFYARLFSGEIRLCSFNDRSFISVGESSKSNTGAFLSAVYPTTDQAITLFDADPSNIKVRITGVQTTA